MQLRALYLIYLPEIPTMFVTFHESESHDIQQGVVDTDAD
jgi:hypothetical protein